MTRETVFEGVGEDEGEGTAEDEDRVTERPDIVTGKETDGAEPEKQGVNAAERWPDGDAAILVVGTEEEKEEGMDGELVPVTLWEANSSVALREVAASAR